MSSSAHGQARPEPSKPRSALASPNLVGQSPRPASLKSVSIAEPESISPSMPGRHRDYDDAEGEGAHFGLDRVSSGPKQYRAGSRRIVARPSLEYLSKARTPADLLKLRSGQQSQHSSQQSKHGQSAPEDMAVPPALSSAVVAAASGSPTSPTETSGHGNHHHKHLHLKGKGRHLTYHDLMKWIQKEKTRRDAHKATKKAKKQERKADSASKDGLRATDSKAAEAVVDGETVERESAAHDSRRPSDASSEGSVALEMLQDILERNMSLLTLNSYGNRSTHSLRPSSIRRLRRGSTTYVPEDLAEEVVPTCDVVLDNSRTLSYHGGVTSAADESRPELTRSFSIRERDAWKSFKYEIVRLAHTLKIKGWRRIPMDYSSTIEVERLSGALTNAVYVVKPPAELPDESQQPMQQSTASDDFHPQPRKSRPQKLLLRIYGAQVDHLIDRESELQVLRRLARKRIGPRLLGTFANGRFEEFFNASPLTHDDLRVPGISQQIAKRMRELHDGIELLDAEVAAGPFVYQNMDNWVGRCEKIVQWVEQRVAMGDPALLKVGVKPRPIVGSFALFKEAVRRYRIWLEETFNGGDGIRERLVFAHNDAQYGNILRTNTESDKSPLLMAENQHKRLIVIDFEYANANVPGLEFANHFTECCYNFHSSTPYACAVRAYPTPAEQATFLTAYITHRPALVSPTHSNRLSTASLSSLASASASASAIAPSSASSAVFDNAPADDTAASSQAAVADTTPHSVKREVDALRWETRAWRGVNSAQWVLWGLVQAKIPGLPDFDADEDEGGQGDGVTAATNAAGATAGGGVDAESHEQAGQVENTEDVSTPRPRDGPFVGAEDAADLPPVSSASPVADSANSTASQQQAGSQSASASASESDPDEEEDGFDYLSYAHERACFFWGDVLALGIMSAEEVGEDVRREARVLDY